MRKEPLVGVFVGVVVVGFFTSTEPNLLMCLILGGIFLALAVQMLVITRRQLAVQGRSAPGSIPSNIHILAGVAVSVAVIQTLVSTWMLLIAGNLFSLFGVLCGACFIFVSAKTFKASEQTAQTPVPTGR